LVADFHVHFAELTGDLRTHGDRVARLQVARSRDRVLDVAVRGGGYERPVCRAIGRAALLARQERGNIRLIVISPWTDLDLVRDLAQQLAPDLEGVPPPIVVTGPKPDEQRLAQLRGLGVAWALWAPADLEDVRFIVTTAMVLPSEQWRRKEQRVPANLPVAINGPGGPKLGRLLSLSGGGAFVATNHLPDPGTRLRLGFYLDGDDVELDAEVVHVTPRPAAWTASFPRGIGIAFADLTPETADEIREWVKRQLDHYAV